MSGTGAVGGVPGWDFFVSYAEADLAWAQWVGWQLEAAGYRVRLRVWEVVPGSRVLAWTHESVVGSRFTLALVSGAYLGDVGGRSEWQAVQAADPAGLGRRLVPVRVDDVALPGLLAQVEPVDLFGLSVDETRRRLVEQVGRVVAGPSRPLVAPPFPGGPGRPAREPVFPGSQRRPVSTLTAAGRGRDGRDPARDVWRSHWEPRARGVEHAATPGWFFTGRRRALAELAGWLCLAGERVDPLRVVSGGPGSGKSAVLARMVTLSDPAFRASWPVSLSADDPLAGLPTGSVEVAVHARNFPTQLVLDAVGQSLAGEHDRGGVWDVDRLVGLLLGRERPLRLVVDALDEADDPEGLARSLRQLTFDGAAGLRLLVGTRPGGSSRRWLTGLGLSGRNDDRALVDLDAPRYLERADVAGYVRQRLLQEGVPAVAGRADSPYRDREELAGRVAEAVADAAGPAFLVAQLTTRALLNRLEPLAPDDPEWAMFPTTVDAALDGYLDSLGSRDTRARVEELMRPLAYARGDGLPLEGSDIWPALAGALAAPGRTYTAADVAWLLKTAIDYLVETVRVGDGVYYRLYHQALADYLTHRDRARAEPAEQVVTGTLLASVPDLPSGGRDWQAAHPYLTRELAGHAAAAGRLAGLLDDAGFLPAADPTRMLGVLTRTGTGWTHPAGVIYQAAHHTLPVGAANAGQRAAQLQLAARRQGHQLAEQIDQQAASRPWSARWVTGPPHSPHRLIGRHSDRVKAVAVGTMDGRTIAVTGSRDTTVRVWDLAAGQQLGPTLHGHTQAVEAVAVGTLDGRTIAVTGSRDTTVRVWDLAAGQQLGPTLEHRSGSVVAVAVGNLDGQTIAIAGSGYGAVPVWDLALGREHSPILQGHSNMVAAVAVGVLDGRTIAVTGSWDHTARVWDLATGRQYGPALTGHTDPVEGVAVGTLDGRVIAVTGGQDETVRVWDLATGRQHGPALTGHTGTVAAVAVGTHEGRPVAVTSSGDDTVRIWDLAGTRQHDPALTGHTGTVAAVAVGTHEGRPVVVSGSWDKTVRIWDLATGRQHGPALVGHIRGVTAVAVGTVAGRFLASRTIAVTGSWDNTVRVWELAPGLRHGTLFTGHTSRVEAVALSSLKNRAVVVTGGADGTVRVWDLASGRQQGPTISGHASNVAAVAVGTLDGHTIAVTGSWDHTVRVWDLASGQQLGRTLRGHSGRVQAVAVDTLNGRTIAVTGGRDDTVRVWDLEAMSEVRHANVDGHCQAVAIDGTSLIVGVGSGVLHLSLLLHGTN